jgi:SAM-dependent methyltransferase
LRRLTPISRTFGFDRGQPIDRYYIENFLKKYAVDIQGRVLEFADSNYTSKFGGDRVAQSDVLHATPGNDQATLVGDLKTGQGIPKDAFDCIILTQVVPFIYDVRASIANCYGSLKPKGVLLATFAGISQISRYDMDRWGDYWRFTDASARQLFGNVFGEANITIEMHGNVAVAIAFLHGLATHELKAEELDHQDPDYQVLITVRAVREGTAREVN